MISDCFTGVFWVKSDCFRVTRQVNVGRRGEASPATPSAPTDFRGICSAKKLANRHTKEHCDEALCSAAKNRCSSSSACQAVCLRKTYRPDGASSFEQRLTDCQWNSCEKAPGTTRTLAVEKAVSERIASFVSEDTRPGGPQY